MKSIIQTGKYCFLCGRENIPLERHHVLNGNPNRALSERYGLWIYLCPEHHRAVHARRELRERYKKMAQERAMKEYHWTEEDFRKVFGKNYL